MMFDELVIKLLQFFLEAFGIGFALANLVNEIKKFIKEESGILSFMIAGGIYLSFLVAGIYHLILLLNSPK